MVFKQTLLQLVEIAQASLHSFLKVFEGCFNVGLVHVPGIRQATVRNTVSNVGKGIVGSNHLGAFFRGRYLPDEFFEVVLHDFDFVLALLIHFQFPKTQTESVDGFRK